MEKVSYISRNGTFSLLKKKKTPRKKIFIFQEMELNSSLILKSFLYFLIFCETETSKKIPYISGDRNPKKASYISGNETLHFLAQAWKMSKNLPQEDFLYFRKHKPRKTSYIFLKESFFYILRNWSSKTELSYISGGTSKVLTKMYHFFSKKKLWTNFSKNAFA